MNRPARAAGVDGAHADVVHRGFGETGIGAQRASEPREDLWPYGVAGRVGHSGTGGD